MNLLLRTLLRGAILLLPALITLWLVWTALAGLDNLGVSVLKLLGWQEAWPGSGLMSILALMILSGTIFRINPMSWIYKRIERIFMRFPVIKTVYGAIRDFVRLMDKDGKQQFKQTVLVDIPGLGPTVGFVTADHLPKAVAARLEDSDTRVSVYLPMSYQIGGYTVFVPRDRVTPVDWSFEDAMRFVITAGVSGTDG